MHITREYDMLTDEELMELEGGNPLAVVATGVAIFMAGRLIGQDIKRKFE